MKSFLAFIILTLAAACATAPPTAPVTAWGPLMTDERFATAQQGMTREEVLSRLGSPRRTVAYAHSGNDSWEFFGYDTWGYQVEYSVTFGPDGHVLSTLAYRLNVGGDRNAR